jgi:predicted O-methyltransferase YrrM
MSLPTELRRLLRPLKRRWLRARKQRALGPLRRYVYQSSTIAGWARDDEAAELVLVARALPAGATIVEVGSFLGSSAVLLAGARKVAGSGMVHCVDPFDGSGDAHSVPVYEELTAGLATTLRSQFEANIAAADLTSWVTVHQGSAEAIAAGWSTSIDLLFLDGDHSPAGARSNYEAWIPFLRAGGTIAIHNSVDRTYSPDHDGQRRVVVESIHPPAFDAVRCVGTTTFASKVGP